MCLCFSDRNDHRYVNALQELVITYRGAKLTLPKFNLSQHENHEFTLDVICDQKYEPRFDSWSALASPVIHLGPHGAKFYPSMPAVVSVPIGNKFYLLSIVKYALLKFIL